MILPTDRIINTREENIDFRKVPCDQQDVGYKPRGLWYAMGDTWLKWMRGEEPEWEKPYNYKIEVNLSKIAILDTPKKVETFCHPEIYGTIRIETMKYKALKPIDMVEINWPAVCHDYSGIELNPYFYELRHYMWYNGWDVPSGCIWKKDAIKKIVRIKD